MTSDKIKASDLTEEQIERVLNTRLFQKGLAYTKLADGIEVLIDQDQVYDSLAESIRKQHSQVGSRKSVDEFFELLVQEVETFTEPLVEDEDGELDGDDLDDLYVEEDQ